ncbi:orotate phosphoribosyltransferase [Atractiella rhizophila]|nr:orotate phosphoribosyltransferase [Atractiella rhizophila]
MDSLPSYASVLLPLFFSSKILTFGSFTLKSGRPSPYFFNLNLLYTGDVLSQLSKSFAQAIISSPLCSNDGKEIVPTFDVIFGPAYKGIPLASTVCVALAQEPHNLVVSYAFNRKEAKDHGEGGVLVGSPLKGKKVLIIDDVITSGLAITEAYDIIVKNGGEVVGVAIVLDRQEKGREEGSTQSSVNELSKKWSVPVITVLKLDNIIEFLKRGGGESEERIKQLEDHRAKFCVV